LKKTARKRKPAHASSAKPSPLGRSAQQSASAAHASGEAAPQAAWKEALAEVDAAQSGEGPEIEIDGGEVFGDDRDQRHDLMLAARSSHQSRKPFELPKVERPKKDMAAALAVLTAVGVDADSLRIKIAGEFFQNVEANVKGIEFENEKVQRDYQKIWQSLESLKLESDRGQQLRDSLLGTLKEERFTDDEIRAGKLREGRRQAPIPLPAEKKAGRRVDMTFAHTIQDFARLFGWTWKECAAAVYVAGADLRDYTAIKKSFRDWDRRHPDTGKL
jgi:hypothetical protein